MKSKWLKFSLVVKGYKTSRWVVESKTGEELGDIKWHPQWRQYCFISRGCDVYSIIWSQGCLRDIADFIKEQMERKK